MSVQRRPGLALQPVQDAVCFRWLHTEEASPFYGKQCIRSVFPFAVVTDYLVPAATQAYSPGGQKSEIGLAELKSGCQQDACLSEGSRGEFHGLPFPASRSFPNSSVHGLFHFQSQQWPVEFPCCCITPKLILLPVFSTSKTLVIHCAYPDNPDTLFILRSAD